MSFEVNRSTTISELYEVSGWSATFYDNSNAEAYFCEVKLGEEGCNSFENNTKCFVASATKIGTDRNSPHDPLELEVITCDDKASAVNQTARSFTLAFKILLSLKFIGRQAVLKVQKSVVMHNVVFCFMIGQCCILYPVIEYIFLS